MHLKNHIPLCSKICMPFFQYGNLRWPERPFITCTVKLFVNLLRVKCLFRRVLCQFFREVYHLALLRTILIFKGPYSHIEKSFYPISSSRSLRYLILSRNSAARSNSYFFAAARISPSSCTIVSLIFSGLYSSNA